MAVFLLIYGARVSNRIFDEDHTQLLLSLGYLQFEGDPRKFKITCPKDPNRFVIINTHVDDGGAILTWRSKYDSTLRAFSELYPGTLDSTAMDRYLGMSFSYNPDTGAMTASMYHSVLKLLVTFSTSSLPIPWIYSTSPKISLLLILSLIKDSLVVPSCCLLPQRFSYLRRSYQGHSFPCLLERCC